ncbi:MAG: haloacid dehalogenase superfamily protein subfamily phosphoserine phosphatase [Actinomycetia bacterium]|nr:haloacid dehalogenase superfamily protein subfamily phosphoserine phosphatase [Actinomycetes bacterium]
MSPPRFDPSNASVFLDFDGTVSTLDIGLVLLERHGHPGWEELDAAFVGGELGSRDTITGQWALVDASEPELLVTAMEVPLDPGFPALVADLRGAGAEVAVLSDGFGFYVEEHCRAAAVDVDLYVNRVDWTTRELRFPFGDPTCACQLCGVCKQAPIRAAAARGRTTVMVGDGASDRRAASIADIVFAKAGLAAWCGEAGVPYTSYVTLRDVRDALLRS